MEWAATSARMAGLMGMGGPEMLVPNRINESSTFDEKRIKKETAEMLDDPEHMVLVNKMQSLLA